MVTPWKKSYDQPRQHIKNQKRYSASNGPYSQSYGFSCYHVWMWELDHNEGWALKNWFLNCGWRRLLRVPWTARRSNQSILREISTEYSLKNWCCSWNSKILASWCKELTRLKRPWCWERLKEGREGVNRGWNGWMASLTQWARVWVNSGSWWWTRKPGVLQSMESQRVRHNLGTEEQLLILHRSVPV